MSLGNIPNFVIGIKCNSYPPPSQKKPKEQKHPHSSASADSTLASRTAGTRGRWVAVSREMSAVFAELTKIINKPDLPLQVLKTILPCLAWIPDSSDSEARCSHFCSFPSDFKKLFSRGQYKGFLCSKQQLSPQGRKTRTCWVQLQVPRQVVCY